MPHRPWRLLSPIGVVMAVVAVGLDVAAQTSKTPAVSMGHLHYRVRDVEANRKFWVALGATPVKWDEDVVVKIGGALIFLSKGESTATTEGSVVNHVAFRVRSLTAVEAAGIKVQPTPGFTGIGSVFTPDGERIELFDETATNLGFTLDDGGKNEQAERHNRALNGSVAFHHIHLYLPTGADAAAKKWYAETFGALPGKRWRYEAADLPGVNLNFSGSDKPGAPLEGRVLDHIGFEVRDLQAFCKRLEGRGTRIAVPYRKDKTGVASAMITDPWGTSIELTEGLSGL